MSHELIEGLEVESVKLPDGTYLKIGEGVESISIVEQKGQMSMVPYVRVIYFDKSCLFVNASNCQGIATAAPVETR